MEERISKLLSDILTSSERIQTMLEGMTLDGFLSPASMTVQDAVARRFTIIGEAAAALMRDYPEFCATHPEIPIRQARGMRNSLVHDYDGVDWGILWTTGKNELPTLTDAIRTLLNTHGE